MKKLQKGLKIILVLIIILVVGLLALPAIFKSDIVQALDAEINASLKANIQFNHDIDVGLISTFPNINIQIHDVRITGINQFANDTLARAHSIRATISLSDLVKQDMVSILGAELISTQVNLISFDGSNNWDIFKESDTSSNLSPNTLFKKIIIKDGSFSYRGDSLTSVFVSGINGAVKGEFVKNQFDLKTIFETDGMTIEYDGTKYTDEVSFSGDAIIDLDLENDTYTFKENQFYTGDLLISLVGDVQLTDSSTIYDLTFGSNQSDFQQFLSLVPDSLIPSFNPQQVSGNASLSGFYKGEYGQNSYPAYKLKAEVTEGEINRKNLASSMRKIHLDAELFNPDGDEDNMTFSIKDLRFLIKEEPFKGNFFLKTPISNPHIKADLLGKIPLGDLVDLFITNPTFSLRGAVLSDLHLDGYYSSIVKRNTKGFNSSGFLVAEDVNYSSSDFPKPLQVSWAELNFRNQHLEIPTLKLSAGSSDLMLGAELDNVFEFVFGDGPIQGSARINAGTLNVADFYLESETLDSTSLVPIPPDISIDLSGHIDKFIYGEHQFEKVVADIKVDKAELQIQKLATQFLNGFINLKGKFVPKDGENAETDISVRAMNLDIATLFGKFNTLRVLAPIAEYATGTVSSTFKLSGQLLHDLSPDLKGLSCSGIMDVFNCDIKGLKSLQDLGTKLQNDKLANVVNIGDLLLSFNVDSGKIEVQPFQLPVQDFIVKISGYNTLDKKINYDGLLTVPKKHYQENADAFNKYVPQDLWSTLSKLEFQDLLFDIGILGTFYKPEVKLRYQKTTKNLRDQVKSGAEKEIEKKKTEAEERAKAEMEKAKSEAEEMKRRAEEEARRAIEAEKKKVEEQIKKEKEKARKRIEEELRKKTGGIFKKG